LFVGHLVAALHCDPGYTMPHAAVQLRCAGTRNHDFGDIVGDGVFVREEEGDSVREFDAVPECELEGVRVTDPDGVPVEVVDDVELAVAVDVPVGTGTHGHIRLSFGAPTAAHARCPLTALEVTSHGPPPNVQKPCGRVSVTTNTGSAR